MNELAFLLRVFLGSVLRAFFPAAFDEAKKSLRDTAEDARSQPELKSRLQKRIHERWRGFAMAGGLALVCFAGAGCGSRVYFVPASEPVRLREAIPNAKVWVMGADGVPVATTYTLAAGLYVLSDPGDVLEPESKPIEPAEEPLGVVTPDIPTVTATPALTSRFYIPE